MKPCVVDQFKEHLYYNRVPIIRNSKTGELFKMVCLFMPDLHPDLNIRSSYWTMVEITNEYVGTSYLRLTEEALLDWDIV